MSTHGAAATCKRERTRCTIVAAAIGVIGERGPEGLSIDQIMAATGMARGTFYNYFQSREEVIRAALEDVQQILRAEIEDHIPEQLPAEAVVACMIHAFLQYALDNPRIGWAMARIGVGRDWLTKHDIERQVFPRADRAVRALLGGCISFTIAQAYIEGVINLSLRRLLEGHLQLQDAEQLLALTLRGLGVADGRVQAALAEARDFSHRLRAT